MSALQGVFSIVGAITGRIVEPVIQLVVLHVGFVFQYKKKQEKLEVEIKNLEEKRKQIKEKVDEAITRGEEVDEPVSNWLAEVEERVPKFKDENTVNENMQCSVFLCPDYISRYRMSKEAENKIEEVKKFTQSGNFSTVAHPKPFAQELQFTSSSTNYVNFESRELVFNNIMAALQNSNVKMIGVYGTGGVGKTTMNRLFDEVVVAVVSQDANVSNIQGQLAVRLNLELQGETHEVGKASKLWNRLNNGKKNLIILDDMWQNLDLKRIGIPIIDGNNCCKVVMTSRIRGVLEEMHVDRYVPMQVLSKKEAWALFKTKVGNSVDSPELHDIADAVCKECGGLPVAILAVGAALKYKKKYVWEDVLDQFKDSMLKNIAGIDAKVYASLKLSYDRLESSDAKSCFLLCCFFPEDANISIEVLARHCIARSLLGQNTNTLRRASRRVLTVVDILKDACLLLKGKDENFVKMHDVIRDVALSIAKDDGKEILVKHGDKKWLEKDTCESSSAMSLRFDNTLELLDDLVCPQLHTLTILWDISPLLNVPDRFFSGMEKLTILELHRICMLPPLSLANLVNLRMLWLDDCKLGDIAILKDLNNNLEILSLRGSNIEVLPSEIGQLTRLRLLDLGNCYKLREIPQGVISNLSRLEELYILDEYRQERSKVNLDELGKLTQLTTLQIHIPNVMLLPKDFCFENLIRFKISIGIGMRKGMGISKTYSKSCKLWGVSLMDKFIVLLLTAEALLLENIEGLQEVLHDRGGEGSLMERHGLNPSGFFNNLIELTIKDCRLEYLFSLSCARGFSRLQRLQIVDCEMMEAIVGIEEEKDEDELSSQVINFSQLKYLDLVNLPKLISFYPKVEKMTTSEGNSSTQAQSLFNEKVTFPTLETLQIKRLKKITEIWDRKLLPSESFQQLRNVTIKSCKKLVNVGSSNMPRQLPKLKRLEASQCQELKVIVLKNGGEEEEKAENNNNTNSFLQLTSLTLEDLQSLKSFFTSRSETQSLFTSQVTFPALERLQIKRLTKITKIWDRKLLPSESFQQLRNVTIKSCQKLVNVGSSNMPRQLTKLEQLEVSQCRELKVIILKNWREEEEKAENNNNTNSFLQLKSLTLENLKSLKSFFTSRSETQSLFTSQVTFPALERLQIKRLTKITEIWDRKLLPSESFQQLRNVTIKSCQKLVNVGSCNMPRQLTKLEQLEVSECRELKVIVLKNEGEEEEKAENNNNTNSFLQLTSLRLEDLQSLKSFFTSRSETQSLFTSQVTFPALETLQIKRLTKITEIWDRKLLPLESFQQLRNVTIKSCQKLVNVGSSNMPRQLPKLKQLEVSQCRELKVIVLKNGGEEEEKAENNNNTNSFLQLTSLRLEDLQSLKSFFTSRSETQSLFTSQVTFPALGRLQIKRLTKITEIWDRKLLPSESFQQLRNVTIKSCQKLVNVGSSNMPRQLPKLKRLEVSQCRELKVIVLKNDGEEEEKVENNNNTNSFLQLTSLRLEDLQSLKSFFTSRSETQSLFTSQVAFPVLVYLKIQKLPTIIQIWDKQLLIASEKESKSFNQLKGMMVFDCEKLEHVVQFNMLPRLQNLNIFRVYNCPKVEVVVSEKEKEEGTTNNDIIVFSQLTTLNLYNLVNLRSFYNWPTRSEAQPLFNNQV
ncbi:disease resistance protein At4g27190-like [Camellia sinensis]|uniref:disease resistance protein At4g27190-like n=1 Tax=Camellia sinensis TaxID=4442 RepID=UPI00103644EC|nr:disease resistance protein At4g27190-like [Camellia sinensis]